MKSLTRVAASLFVLSLLLGADYDTSKLPEGSVSKGTYKVRNKKETIFSSGLEVKFTKREKDKFEGQWTNLSSESNAAFEIKGTISGNKLTFTFVNQLEGKDVGPGVIGSLKPSGTLTTKDGETRISGTTANRDRPNNTGSWEASLQAN